MRPGRAGGHVQPAAEEVAHVHRRVAVSPEIVELCPELPPASGRTRRPGPAGSCGASPPGCCRARSAAGRAAADARVSPRTSEGLRPLQVLSGRAAAAVAARPSAATWRVPARAPRPCVERIRRVLDGGVPEDEVVHARIAGGVDLRPHLLRGVVAAVGEVLEPVDDPCAGAAHLPDEVLRRGADDRVRLPVRVRDARTRPAPNARGRASARCSRPRAPSPGCPGRLPSAASRRRRKPTRRGARSCRRAPSGSPAGSGRSPPPACPAVRGSASRRAGRPGDARSRRGSRRRRARPRPCERDVVALHGGAREIGEAAVARVGAAVGALHDLVAPAGLPCGSGVDRVAEADDPADHAHTEPRAAGRAQPSGRRCGAASRSASRAARRTPSRPRPPRPSGRARPR